MNYSTLDDAALMGSIARAHGDTAHSGALAELYDRYGRLVYTVAIHVVGDPETAEEITQDVFVRAWEGANTYRPDVARVGSWLVSIARHRAIDELRRRGVRPEKASVEWPEEAGLENGLPTFDDPEDTVESLLRNRHIRLAVASLPNEQRQVLGLAFFKGMSHSEIADTLGEPLGTVKSRIRLAMRKLRDALVERGIDRPS